MSLDAVYADDIEANLLRWAANPPPPQDESFSMKSFIGAGLKGIPAAVLEVSGGAVDATSGYGNVMAATGGTGRGMFSLPTEDERKQEAQARDRMLAGDNQNVATGNVLRKKAEEFAPDPITANRADQVIFGLTRFAGKAVGYVGAMGPAGAIPLGLEEGNTETQRLRLKGIDDETAVKVGAVQGVTSAIGAVLPMGGKTVLQTLGLVAAGGPGMFMAQEATSREILQRAGHKDEASLHNPFDPLGLVLSTVIPGAFGAVHMRNLPASPKLVDVVKHIESGGNPNAVGPEIPGQGTAKGEMQVMDATNVDPGFGVTPAKDNSPEERARVGREYLGAMVTRYGDQDKALAAYNAGPGTVDKAMAAHGDSWLAHMPEETQKYVAKARKLTGDYVASEGAKNPEVVDAARVSVLNDTMQRNLPDDPDAFSHVQRASDIVAESGGRAAEAATPEPVRSFSERLDAALAERGVAVRAGDRSEAGGEAGTRVITLADMPEADFMALHGNSVEDVKAHEFAHTFWAGATALPNFRDPRNAGLKRELVTVSQEFRPGAWEQAREHTSKPDELLADGMAFWLKNPARRADFPLVDKLMRSYDSGDLQRNFPDLQESRSTPGKAAGREPNNALPAADSVSVAGDQPAPRGAEVGAAHGLDAVQQMLDAVDKGGLPLNPAKLRALAEDMGLEVSKSAKPEETIQRIREAAARAKEQAAQMGTTAGSEATPSLDQTVAKKIAAEQPDLQVVLPGTEERISVAEALKRIAEEQKQDGHWADLVKVAAECALTAG